MTVKYYVTLTDYGATLVAQAHDIASIQLTQLVVGDANGIPYEPITKKSRIALVNQKAAVPVQSVAINGAVTTVTATLEANIGGFNLHEIGLKDNTGKLVYIGNYHGGYKAVIEEGAGGELTIIIDITAQSGKDALISIDPNVVTANKQWALDNFVRIPTFEQHVLDNTNQHNDFQNQINTENSNRISSDNLLNDKIDYEIGQRTNAINQERDWRTDADNALQTNINNEALVRLNADNALQGNINNEQAARIYSDNLLNDKIDNADADLENRKFNKLGGTISGDVNITGELTTKDFRPVLGNQFHEWNLGIGREALKEADSATRNIAIGQYSQRNNISSIGNISIGFEALYGHINGDGNIAIGNQAATLLDNGYGNIIIGNHLYFQDNINQTVAIGGDAVTGSDQFQLGNSNHTVYCYGSVQNRSDIRDKADIRDTALGLDFINKLRPVDYKWDMREDYRENEIPEFADEESKNEWTERNKISNIQHNGTHKRNRFHHGLIAQEVQQIINETGIDFGGFQDHSKNDGEDVLSIGYSELIAPLIKAVQELSLKVKQLEEE